jgi:hypothetical protein
MQDKGKTPKVIEEIMIAFLKQSEGMTKEEENALLIDLTTKKLLLPTLFPKFFSSNSRHKNSYRMG